MTDIQVSDGSGMSPAYRMCRSPIRGEGEQRAKNKAARHQQNAWQSISLGIYPN